MPPSHGMLVGSGFAIPQAFRNNGCGSFLSKSFNCLTYSPESSWGRKHSRGQEGNPSVHVVNLLWLQRPRGCHDGARCSTSCSHLPLRVLPALRQYSMLTAFRDCQQGRAVLYRHCMRPVAMGSLQELLLTAASATGRRGASAGRWEELRGRRRKERGEGREGKRKM